MKKQRPNTWHNRYNQWTLAGKIALAINAMPKVTEAAMRQLRTASGDYNIYCTDSGEPHYSIIGQEWLYQLGIDVTELTQPVSPDVSSGKGGNHGT